jgi:hypothetical protein
MKHLLLGLVTFGSISAFAQDHVCLSKARTAFTQSLENAEATNIIKFEPVSRSEVRKELIDNGYSGRDLKRALAVIDQNPGGYMFEVDTEHLAGYQKEIIFTYSERRNCTLKPSRLIIAQD